MTTRTKAEVPRERSCPMPDASKSAETSCRPSRSVSRIRICPVTITGSPTVTDEATLDARARHAQTV